MIYLIYIVRCGERLGVRMCGVDVEWWVGKWSSRVEVGILWISLVESSLAFERLAFASAYRPGTQVELRKQFYSNLTY